MPKSKLRADRPIVPRRTAPPPSRETAAPRPRRRWLGWCLRWSAITAIWLILGAGGLVAWYAVDLPDIDAAIAATRQPSIRVLAGDGTELATAGDLYGVPVQVSDLPPALPAAFLATEDRRFYDHFGLDPRGLLRASIVNIKARRIVQGGSTITQQVAKNLFLTHDRTAKRKVQELLLALWLEQKLTKDQILSLYLNRAYFGAGAYGVDAAAHKYFDVPAARVSTYQAAMLAGLVRAPSRYNPHARPDLADGRARQVLLAMVDAGFMTEAEAAAALRHRGSTAVLAGPRRGSRWFVDWVLELVPDFVAVGDHDLVVTTTLHPGLQHLAETQVRGAVGAAAATEARVGQAALVALSTDGAVRALVGGRDYRGSQFNRAVQARRQPGSAFKPFVYLAALEAGWSPESRVLDAPVSVEGWRPRNFTDRYRGDISMSEALTESVNTVAVRLSEAVGRTRVRDVARRLGITAPLPATPSVALGAGEVNLLELTAAYGVFANGGLAAWPYAIVTIHDADGRLLYQRAGRATGRIVAEHDVAAMSAMLGRVVDHGTGRAARLDRPAAGKTGTSQNFRDAWFVGYTADLVAGVWMGNDDGTPMKKVTGGSLPAQLWRGFMLAAHDGLPARALYRSPAVAAPAAPYQGPPVSDRTLFERLLDSIDSHSG